MIPLDAVREALINACCHRDYSNYGGSIKLAIYDDRMEIMNHGGLLSGLTLEKIKNRYSQTRNPLIADILYRCRLIERYGRGHEIIKDCLEAGDPEPQFQCDEYYFQVTFEFPRSIKPEVIQVDDGKAEVNSLTNRQKEIISILESLEEAKTSEISHKLKENISDRTLRRELLTLKRLGIIRSYGRGVEAKWQKSKKLS